MTLIIILVLSLLIILFLVWFMYRMGHPAPGEPRFIYNFRRNPSAIPEYLALLARGLFHPHLLRSGSSKQERLDVLPGDDLIPRPQFEETRAATIDVPLNYLWPWIVQLGGGRGGWYWWTPGEAFPEYTQYVTNTTEILEQFQLLEVGDRLSDGGPYVTEDRGNWIVKAVEPNQHLVLYAARQVSGGADFDPARYTPKGIWFVSSWAFVLRSLGSGQTRLLVRLRVTAGPPIAFLMLRPILGIGDRVAHQSMFERIKARAEAYYKQRGRILLST